MPILDPIQGQFSAWVHRSGYTHLLRVLANRNDEEQRHMRAWIGASFDSRVFELAAVNRDVATIDL